MDALDDMNELIERIQSYAAARSGGAGHISEARALYFAATRANEFFLAAKGVEIIDREVGSRLTKLELLLRDADTSHHETVYHLECARDFSLVNCADSVLKKMTKYKSLARIGSTRFEDDGDEMLGDSQ